MIKQLITSYDVYEDLLAKSGQGHEYYKKLEENVNRLLQRCRSVCKVQNEEREQIKARFAPKGQSYSLYVCSVVFLVCLLSRIPCMSAQSYSLYVCSVVFLVCLLSRIPCMSAQSYSLYVCRSVCKVQNEEREQIKARFAPKGQSYSLYVCSVVFLVCLLSRIPCMSAQSYSLYVCSVVFLVCLLSRIPCMSAQSYSLYVCSVVFLVCLLSRIPCMSVAVCVKSRTRSESRSKPDSLLKVSRIPCMSAQCVQNEEREQIKARFAPKGQSYSLYVRASCYSTRLSWAHTPVINWAVCLGQKVSS